MTAREAVDRYVAEARATIVTWQRAKRLAEEWRDHVGADRDIGAVTAEEVRQYRRELLARLSPASVNHHIMAIRGVYELALDAGWEGRNPARRIRRLAASPPRTAYLRDVDQPRLLGHAIDHGLADMIRLALHTGMRVSEQLGTSRAAIDLEAGQIRLQRTKNGQGRTVPLNSAAVEIVRRQLAAHESDWLYPAPRDPGRALGRRTMYKRWEHAREAAGLPDLRWHDLRATCATRMLEEGATVEEVRAQLGHASVAVISRYIRLVDARQREAVERLVAREQRP
jgi:integrase